MSLPVVNGDMLMCSMGVAPSPITVLPVGQVTAQKRPMATIMDNIPFVNIASFGTCMSLANPATATLTAAALGVLTPGPCAPVVPAPWAVGAPTVLIGGKPALNATSKCVCAYGGMISVTAPTATLETVP